MQNKPLNSFNGVPTSTLQAEADYIGRSLSWTFSRAGREGTEVDLAGLKDVIGRENELRDEIRRRKEQP